MLPLVCVTTGISHRVQLAILVNFPNAVLNAKRFYNHLKFLVDSAITLILISIVPLNNMPNKTSLLNIL